MTPWVVIVLAATLVVAAAVGLGWRFVSRRRETPCPWWLGWALEGGPIDWVWSARRTIARMELQPGQRVLEIGPGPGRVLIPAARVVGASGPDRHLLPPASGQVGSSDPGIAVGIDIQAPMVERLRENARAAGLRNLIAIAGDGTLPHVVPGTFDVAFLCATLGEIPDREAALRQCHAALKPGGRLCVTELFPDPHYQPPRTVRRLAESVGFRFLHRRGSWLFFTSTFEKPDGSA